MFLWKIISAFPQQFPQSFLKTGINDDNDYSDDNDDKDDNDDNSN